MKYAVLGIAALASIAFVGQAKAAVLHNYNLDGTLADSLGGPSLVASGGTLGATGYSFGANQGLSLSGLNLTSDGVYEIALGFSFSNPSGYRKIIDFKNLTSDIGLYSLNSSLNFYPVTTGPSGVFLPNQLVNLVVSRTTTGLITTSVNGIFQFSFLDASNLAISDTLKFFIDDLATGQGEASAGFVDYIKISGTSSVSTVPLPASLPLLAAGLAGLGLVRRRKAKLAKAQS